MKGLKLLLLVLLWLGLSQNAIAQPFQIGHTTLNFVDASRNNRVIATEVYYPSNTAGEAVPVAAVGGPFPVLSFGHGFVMTWDAYQNYWTALVPQGYIMLFPKTEGSLSPSHLDFGKDLAFLIDQMALFNANPTSVFYNKVSAMNAVMGHSMGGGASFLATQQSSNITTIVNFAPAETNPSAVAAAGLSAIPTLIFSGANDCVTPPNVHQIPMYNGSLSSCKTLISINGGSHCYMANNNFFCNVGESSCSPQASISRAAQHSVITAYVLPWLDFQLKGNCAQGAVFDSQLVTDNAITYQKNCIQCNALTTETNVRNGIRVYPNPVTDFITMAMETPADYQVNLYDSRGRLLLSKAFGQTVSIDVSGFQDGLYFYSVLQSEKVLANGKFIK
jgi:pimeloyl-ACP methyl ester carboxylesterase